jgi:membrane protease YdiL (CAAX protease family)
MAAVRSTEDGARPTGAAPTLGLVLTGVALAAAFLPWAGATPVVDAPAVDGSALAAGLALVATAAFALRRYDALDRRVGSVVAGLFCVGVAGVALYRLVRPAVDGATPEIGIGLPIAAGATFAAVFVAVADWLALPDDSVRAKVRGFGVAVLLGLLGIAVSYVVAGVLGSLAVPFGRNVLFSVSTVGSGLGLVLFTLGYVRYRGFDPAYLDFTMPDRRDAAYAIGGLVLLLVVLGGVGFAFERAGLPTATSAIERQAQGMANPVFLLALVPLSFLAIGLGEELVFRNVVQKYLYDAFSRRSAVVMASLAFGAVHFRQYAAPNPVATLSTLCIVFSLSLVLGWLYHRTENLLVPVFVHGAFNAIQFAALYLRLTGGWSALGF